MTPPRSLMATALPAAPALAWPRVAEGHFVAGLLGWRLAAAGPAAQALQASQRLPALDAQGLPCMLAVLSVDAPHALRVAAEHATGHSALSLNLQAREGGSRLVVLQEALESRPLVGVAALLAAAAPAEASQRVADAHALAAARAYLAGTAEAVAALLRALPAERGHRQPDAGGFSLAAHVWHLADLDELGWLPRFTRLLAEASPHLAGVDGDRLAIERHYQGRPWRGAARRFLARRRACLALLARYRPADLARPAHFSERGPTDAGELLAAMVAHDQEHRTEMARLWPLEEAA
jgi:uncharacterized damage-inducible protein DinB